MIMRRIYQIDSEIIIGDPSAKSAGRTVDESEESEDDGQWRDGGTLAAVYVAQLVTIDCGYICVDQSLTSLGDMTAVPAGVA